VLRVVLDVNVLVSALLRRDGTPANVLRAWENGLYEFIASAGLLSELERVLRRPHIARSIAPNTVVDLVANIQRDAVLGDDPPAERYVRSDPDDDCLVALALAAGAHVIVSGDKALLALDLDRPRILTPRDLLTVLAQVD